MSSTAANAALSAGGATGSRLYYGTDVRAQAILVGVAVAMLLTPDRRGDAPRLGRSTAEAIGWAGTLLSISAFFIHSFRVWAEQPIFAAIDTIACQREPC